MKYCSAQALETPGLSEVQTLLQSVLKSSQRSEDAVEKRVHRATARGKVFDLHAPSGIGRSKLVTRSRTSWGKATGSDGP